MSEAPKEIWAGPDEKRDWGVLHYGDDMFWETPENSVPEDREGLTHYTRTNAITPQMAAKLLLDRWGAGEFEDGADAIADDAITDQWAHVDRTYPDANPIIEAWLSTIAQEGKQ